MRLTIEPTKNFEKVNGNICRIWRGVTDLGVEALVYVATVQPQTHDPELLAAFDAELNYVPVEHRRIIMAHISLAPPKIGEAP